MSTTVLPIYSSVPNVLLNRTQTPKAFLTVYWMDNGLPETTIRSAHLWAVSPFSNWHHHPSGQMPNKATAPPLIHVSSVRNASSDLQRDPGSPYTTLKTYKANLYCQEGVSVGLSGHHRAKLTYINDSQSSGHVSSPLCHAGTDSGAESVICAVFRQLALWEATAGVSKPWLVLMVRWSHLLSSSPHPMSAEDTHHSWQLLLSLQAHSSLRTIYGQ